MKRLTLLALLLLFMTISLHAQKNDFFIKLRDKELATFNDAITLMRLVFNEQDMTENFVINALWAAEKKLFKVSIPIEPNSVNPVISRKEFAYWLCRLSELGGSSLPATRGQAFKRAVHAGILYPGRGPDDSFTGLELLDTFAYFDYFVRSSQVVLRFENVPLFQDNYSDIPDWRAKLYDELDEQREYERKLREERKNKAKKKKSDLNTIDEEINIKIVE